VTIPLTLWLVRHAQPCIGPGVCYGALDIPAESQASQQAAAALAAALPQNVQIWSSPLQRCEQLTQSLCGLRPDLAYKTDARLVEMNFGQWEGVPWADIPRTALDAWTADFGNHRFGGVESANEVLRRVAGAWRDTQSYYSDHVDRVDSNRHVVWITHAGVIRAQHLLVQGVTQVSDASQWPAQAPGFGGYVISGQSAIAKRIRMGDVGLQAL
jgi:alpha-ribazole phosphatase